MSVRALLFDTFGTLVDWRSSLIAELSAFGAARALEVDWTQLVDDWRAAYAPSMQRVRTGALPWTVLDELHRASLEKLLAERGLRHAFSDADLEHLTHAWHRLHPWPDTVSSLEKLREYFILGLLSNGNVALLIDLVRFARLPVEMSFGSDLFRHYKPDPETYLGACSLLRLPPEEVMLVAAHNYDLRAAAALGLRTGFVARPLEYGPQQEKDIAAENPWDVISGDLHEFATRLLSSPLVQIGATAVVGDDELA